MNLLIDCLCPFLYSIIENLIRYSLPAISQALSNAYLPVSTEID